MDKLELIILPANPGVVYLSIHRRIVINSDGKLKIKKNVTKIGFTVKEKIGVAVINPRGIAKVYKSLSDGK